MLPLVTRFNCRRSTGRESIATVRSRWRAANETFRLPLLPGQVNTT